jgi:hypothetical protein
MMAHATTATSIAATAGSAAQGFRTPTSESQLWGKKPRNANGKAIW